MKEEKRDIRELGDIKLLVDSFYSKVREDALIGPIFADKIGDRWPEHMDRMYRFWQGILLDEHSYHGRPFPPHARLPIDIEHFNRWLTLFYGTVDELYSGSVADEAKARAKSIANIFHNKIRYLREGRF